MISLNDQWDPSQTGPIGVFDSGYGGLTVLKELQMKFPQHDFLYLGDNARAPYGTRSFETIHHYCLEAVQYLFEAQCPLVLFACNTASAKALRTLQQKHLSPDPQRRVLGIIRPVTEHITQLNPKAVGILGTTGTVQSQSYQIELAKMAPQMKVYQQACPMLVPLIENQELNNPASHYFIEKYLQELLLKASPDKQIRNTTIEQIVLACTHYPILLSAMKRQLKSWGLGQIQLISQGQIVAQKLEDYLGKHPQMLSQLSVSSKAKTRYLTTETHSLFNQRASLFLDQKIESDHVYLKPSSSI